MKVTMKKIAADLNISKMTVSRYFNGGYVSEETKQRIEAYVQECGYTPNVFAQNLKSESNIIGFITPRMDSITTNKLISGILEEAKKNNIRVMFHATNFDKESEVKAINEFRSLNAKGIIIVATPDTEKNLKNINANNIIVIGLKVKTNANIMYPESKAVEEILNNSKYDEINYIYSKQIVSHRRKIVEKLCKENSIKLEVTPINKMNNKIKENVLYICSTDKMAYELYRNLNEDRNKIGVNFEVIGFGDYDQNDIIYPSLTSVSYPYEQAGLNAVSMIANNDYRSYETDYEIKYRDSFKSTTKSDASK